MESPNVITRFSLGVDNERADTGLDGLGANGTGKLRFSCLAHRKQDWQPYPVVTQSAGNDDHTPRTHTHLPIDHPFHGVSVDLVEYKTASRSPTRFRCTWALTVVNR